MPRMPDPRLAALWRARLERFEQSPLTVAEFCEVESVSAASLYQWRRKLKPSPRTKPGNVGEFIAVRLPEVSQAAMLSLPGGATIELPEALRPAQLRRLLAAVVAVTAQATAGVSAEEA